MKWDTEVDGNGGKELAEKFNYSHIHRMHLFFVMVPILFVIDLFNSVLTSQEKL